MRLVRDRAWLTGRGLLAAALIAGAPHAALAMGIREGKRQLARAPGGAALYEVRGVGPEGGGSLTYRVQGKSRADVVDFLVSSDYGPGDGSMPQIVSPQVCRERLAALGAELTKRKIPGVTLHPEACGSENRAGLVVAKQ
jgi:hypothetical protein